VKIEDSSHGQTKRMKQALQQCVDSDEEKEESIIDHKI
jgi:hypothetical protein